MKNFLIPEVGKLYKPTRLNHCISIERKDFIYMRPDDIILLLKEKIFYHKKDIEVEITFLLGQKICKMSWVQTYENYFGHNFLELK
jgi:hypothetical protein